MSDEIGDVIKGAIAGMEGRDDDGGTPNEDQDAEVETENDDAGDGEVDTGDSDDAAGDDDSVGDAASGDGDDDESGEQEEKPVVETEEDKFAKEHGLEAPKKGKDNRIPYSRVKAIMTKAEDALIKSITGTERAKNDKGEPVSVQDAIGSFVTGLKTENANMKVYNDNASKVEEIMATDAPRYLRLLATYDDRYRQILAPLFQEQPEREEVEEKGLQLPTITEFPEPDLDLGNGRKTYSDQGLKNLIGWAASQGESNAIKKIDKKYGDILKAHKSKTEIDGALSRLESQLDHGRRNWPGFKEIEKDVMEYIASNQHVGTLHDAYILVRDSKISAELKAAREAAAKAEETARKKLLQKKKPKSTSAVAQQKAKTKDTSDVVVESGDDEITAVIKNAVKKMR